MALDSSNVDVALTGAVYYAPTGSTAPTNATAALDAAFLDVGYCSDDGVTETLDRSTSNIVAWQNADVVRTVVTESSISVQFTMIETNPNSVRLFYGVAVAADGSVTIVPSTTGGRHAVVVDYVDGDKMVRLYMPQAEVTELDDVSLNSSGDPVGYTVTITGYPDTTLGGSAKKWFSALDTTTP